MHLIKVFGFQNLRLQVGMKHILGASFVPLGSSRAPTAIVPTARSGLAPF